MALAAYVAGYLRTVTSAVLRTANPYKGARSSRGRSMGRSYTLALVTTGGYCHEGNKGAPDSAGARARHRSPDRRGASSRDGSTARRCSAGAARGRGSSGVDGGAGTATSSASGKRRSDVDTRGRKR